VWIPYPQPHAFDKVPKAAATGAVASASIDSELQQHATNAFMIINSCQSIHKEGQKLPAWGYEIKEFRSTVQPDS
jgi:hypothetical protein